MSEFAMPNGKALIRPVVATTLLVATALLMTELPAFLPRLIDQCGEAGNATRSASVVVVGVLLADVLVNSPIPMRSDPRVSLQMRRLTLEVENVLKGAPLPKAVPVYYFTWAGGFNGPRPLGFWQTGSRRLLWLRRESGVLRTVCDGWDVCTMGVESGSHRGYRPAAEKSLDQAVADVLLTRGEGSIHEAGWAREILFGVPDQEIQSYVVGKLRHLARNETGAVRESACTLLWIYSVDRLDPRVQEEAGQAMHEADCRCSKKPDHNVACR